MKNANVERLGIMVKVTEHKNIQSLDNYDKTNQDEQQQFSYAISGRNNFNPQPTVSREFLGSQQEPLASSAQFLQPPRAQMPLPPILARNSSSSAFGLNQSSTSLYPTMMRTQEQNLLNTLNYCQVNFKGVKSSKLAIRSVKPIKFRLVQIIESDSDSD